MIIFYKNLYNKVHWKIEHFDILKKKIFNLKNLKSVRETFVNNISNVKVDRNRKCLGTWQWLLPLFHVEPLLFKTFLVYASFSNFLILCLLFEKIISLEFGVNLNRSYIYSPMYLWFLNWFLFCIFLTDHLCFFSFLLYRFPTYKKWTINLIHA